MLDRQAWPSTLLLRPLPAYHWPPKHLSPLLVLCLLAPRAAAALTTRGSGIRFPCIPRMNTRHALSALTTGFFAALLPAAAGGARPNIVYVLSDDVADTLAAKAVKFIEAN